MMAGSVDNARAVHEVEGARRGHAVTGSGVVELMLV